MTDKGQNKIKVYQREKVKCQLVCLLKDEQDPTVVIFDIDRGDDE